MNLELDHFFILVEPGAQVAELLLAMGLEEGASNRHEGQGTSNRRFYFSNRMLEFLWVHDEDEALNGPGRELRFPQRCNDAAASPFGVILHRTDNQGVSMPFDGWAYQPDYFPPPRAFHVGANSRNLLEPLCFYVPFWEPKPVAPAPEKGTFKSISHVKIWVPSAPLSGVLNVANNADGLSIAHGEEHLMEVTFDNGVQGFSKDLRPAVPLILRW